MPDFDDAPPELPPIMPGVAAVTLKSTCIQVAVAAPELGNGLFIGPTGALALVVGGHGLVVQFGSLEDIAHLRDVLTIVHDAHARREAYEACEAVAARDGKRATVPGVGHA